MSFPRLLLLSHRRHAAHPTVDAVRLALRGVPPGLAAIILREKDMPEPELIALAREVIGVAHEAGALVFVAGPASVAMACGADGVKVSRGAEPFERVRAVVPERMLVGVGLQRDDLPPARAAFAVLSPVFDTPGQGRGVGLARLRHTCDTAVGARVFALGGVEPGNVASCLAAGAWGVATRGGVLGARDPAGAAARFADAILGARTTPTFA